jgi:cellulose synthase/poly-beta-1,6-N-acetylglucosamine synthase-like glycosyltransferase
MASQILLQSCIYVRTFTFITFNFLFLRLRPELIQILNLHHFFVLLLALTGIFKLLKFVLHVLFLLRRDVSYRYLVFIPQVHLLEQLEVLVLAQCSMLRQLFPADVSDLIEQVVGVRASGEVL